MEPLRLLPGEVLSPASGAETAALPDRRGPPDRRKASRGAPERRRARKLVRVVPLESEAETEAVPSEVPMSFREPVAASQTEGSPVAVVAGRPAKAGASAEETAPLKKPNILIVDDDPSIRTILEKSLEQLPFAIETQMASNGFEGLEMAGKVHPDLIILDIIDLIKFYC